jgi:hypothetical protein
MRPEGQPPSVAVSPLARKCGFGAPLLGRVVGKAKIMTYYDPRGRPGHYRTTTFGAMTLGYTTNRDLSSIGSLLFMGLIGLVIASIVNIFLGSSTLQFVISIVGVIVFVGLTAYDTQRIKEIYLESHGTEAGCKKAILGALSLYLDFINLLLLQIERSFAIGLTLRQTESGAPLRVG